MIRIIEQINKLKKGKILFPLLFVLIPLPSIFGLVHKGFFDPHDMHHLADIYEMYRGFLSGQFPPRLGPDFSFGFTYPLFNYYYLLPFYIGAFFYFILGNLTLSLKLVLLLALLVSYVGMYLFLRLHFNKISSLSGATLFLYTPYRAVQVYVRGSVGEALALALLPWVMFFVGKYVLRAKNRDLALGSFAFFLLIITHNYFFALSLPIIVLYSVAVSRDSGNSFKKLSGVLLMVFLGFGGSTYWVLPALLEKSLVRGQTPFLLADHFPFLKQLILPSWGYGASVWGPHDGLSFQIGLLNLVAFLGLLTFFLYTLVRKKKVSNNTTLIVFTLLGFLVSFIFMNIRTLPIWNIVPFHNLIQFPWRLLSFTTFFSAIALSATFLFLKPVWQKAAFAVVVLVSAVLSISYFHPSNYLYKSDAEYLNLFFNTKSYSEDYLLLPLWVEERPPSPSQKLFESKNATILEEQKRGLLRWNAKIESNSSSLVLVNLYYFPGWTVSVNGKLAEINSSGKYGKIAFVVPEGISEVQVGWGETGLRKFADFVTLTFLLGIVLLYYLPDRDNKN